VGIEVEEAHREAIILDVEAIEDVVVEVAEEEEGGAEGLEARADGRASE
jgi:hypothetical protein